MTRFTSARIAGGLLAVLTVSACISIPQQGIPYDAPTYLRPGADALKGRERSEVLVKAPATVKDVRFHTGLVRDVSKRVRGAVISLYVKTRTPVRLHLLPIDLPLTSIQVRLPGQALGSGFLIHSSGYALTNNHVVRDATSIRALTIDEVDHEVTVIARDPAYDLALLKIHAKDEKEFPVLPMGDSEKVAVGDMTIAVGNPLGLGHTVTFGIISQTARNLLGVTEEEGRPIRFLQTDTAINPGSSGGPLITLNGAWVGVNTAGALQAQGIGFAVPSAQVQEFIDEVLAGQGVREP